MEKQTNEKQSTYTQTTTLDLIIVLNGTCIICHGCSASALFFCLRNPDMLVELLLLSKNEDSPPLREGFLLM